MRCVVFNTVSEVLHHTADLFKDRIRSEGGYVRCGYVKTEDTLTTGYVRDRILNDEDTFIGDTFGEDTFGVDTFGKDTK